MPHVAKFLEVKGNKAESFENQASYWLANGNEAAEKGKKELAEKCYAKAQYWLDRANKARGWS